MGPFSVLAMVFLLKANVFTIFLGCLCFHPLLNGMIVWADTDFSAPDMKSAKKGGKKITDRKYKNKMSDLQQPPLLDTVFLETES
jgi:hypothetical protein